MLRGENICCGVATTGTGTLTLASCPSGVGGIDPFIAFGALGLGTSQSVPISYTLTEYSASTFATPVRFEKGVGFLTLGASIGACTLTRSPQVTWVASTSSYSDDSPAPISIGTAANTLLMIAPAASDLLAFAPFFSASVGDGLGVAPLSAGTYSGTASLSGTGKDYIIPCIFPVSMKAKRLSIRVGTAYTGGTSNVWGRLYGIGSSGTPGKLLADYGVFGTSGASLTTTGNISTALLSTAPYLTPGAYILSLYAEYSGGSGTPALQSAYLIPPPTGTQYLEQYTFGTNSSGSSTAPDPYSGTIAWSNSTHPFAFTISNQ